MSHLRLRLALATEREDVWGLRVRACELHLQSTQDELVVANRERRWRAVRDVALVGLGAGAVLAGAWAVQRVR